MKTLYKFIFVFFTLSSLYLLYNCNKDDYSYLDNYAKNNNMDSRTKFSCNPKGYCIPTEYGIYDTLEECKSKCKKQTYGINALLPWWKNFNYKQTPFNKNYKNYYGYKNTNK